METIKFGNYYQTNDKNKEAIEWLVLDEKENGKILLISKYALDCKPFNQSCCDITWEKCDLRKWLHSDFMDNAFSEEEQQAIVLTKNKTKGSRKTEDKVFLLSTEEAHTYLTQEERKCMLTPYAKLHNAWYGGDNFCCWWLRSPGNSQIYVANVFVDGDVYNLGGYVSNGNYVVRPCIWIDSSKLEL